MWTYPVANYFSIDNGWGFPRHCNALHGHRLFDKRRGRRGESLQGGDVDNSTVHTIPRFSAGSDLWWNENTFVQQRAKPSVRYLKELV